MKIHTKLYMEFFDYVIDDFIPCEECGRRCVDVHHLEAKGMGGSKSKDYIENLVGLCREHHNRCHKDKSFNNEVKIRHQEKVGRMKKGLNF